MSPANAINQAVDHLFRHEAGKMTAVLTKLMGIQHLATAEDIVQDTLLQAMQTWSFGTMPENPPAWLYRVAKNKAIDHLRRERKFREISPQYAYLLQSEYTLSPTVTNLFLENEIQDSQLRMMFACCHPSIPGDSQVALVLKTLCGLSVAEIARAYLVGEDTIAKRIYRAKEKLQTENIELEVPVGNELPNRLDAVLKSLYLLFNEGYNSSHPDMLIRDELCEEALRLSYWLSEHPLTCLSVTNALLALMCFQSSRLKARMDDQGHIILLKYQDRSLWSRELINRGYYYIDRATDESQSTPFHLEAAIASLHAAAASFERTDWRSVHELYEVLYRMQPSPFVALNKTIASAYAVSPEFALNELKTISGLENYYLYYATAGELYFETGMKQEAREHFQKAAALTQSQSEKQFLLDRLRLC